MNKKFYLLAALAAGCLAGGNLSAGIIHSDVVADHVVFTAIEESSPSGDPLPLYGQPSAVGDTLVFAPTSDFHATSNGGGTDITDGRLQFMIEAKPGESINLVDFIESGGVTLDRPSGNQDDPFAAVTGVIDIDIVGVDGLSIAAIDLAPITMTYSPSAGDFLYSVDAGGAAYATDWSGGANVDVTAALDNAGVAYQLGASKLVVTLDNILFGVATADGSLAQITKDDFEVRVNVPEPTSLALLIGSMLACVAARRSR